MQRLGSHAATILLILAVALTAGTTVALGAPAGNADCLACHAASDSGATPVDFQVPDVELAKCNACHWYGVHSFDIFHAVENNASDYMSRQCNSCHHDQTDFPTRPAIVPWPSALTSSGWFQSAASLESTPGAIHGIHVNGSWLAYDSECSSCHGAASCDACHTSPAPTHLEHGALGTREVPVSVGIGKKYGDVCPDTYMYSYQPNTNYDSGSAFYAGRTGNGEERILLRFPLAKFTASSISTATLRLTRSSGSSFPLRAYRLRRTDWVASKANWNVYKSGSAWGWPGAGSASTDYIADLYSESATGVFDVTALLRAATADGGSSLDLLILDPAPVVRRYAGFYSSATIYADWAPVLEVIGSQSSTTYAYGPAAGTEEGSDSLPPYVTEERTCVAAACHDPAEAAGDAFVPSCASCHEERTAPHGYDQADHAATVGDQIERHAGFRCRDCHSMDLYTEHTKVSSSSAASGCNACHSALVDELKALGGWDGTCAQGGCHTSESSKPMHTVSSANALHDRLSPENDACFGSGCHRDSNVGATLMIIHSTATTSVADAEVTSCLVCHAASVPTTRNCVDCHSSEPHGDFATLHTYSGMDASCLGAGCHVNELATQHEPFVGAGNRYPEYSSVCQLCHANADASRIPADATAACASCHAAQPHPADLHETNVACDACHAVANIASVHGDNCGLCHPTPVSSLGTWNKTCEQAGCHAEPLHPDMSYDHEWDYMVQTFGDDCWRCHEDEWWGCTAQCHPHVYERVPPVTTANVQQSYVGAATITLSATDAGEPISTSVPSGVKATYYRVDGGAVQTGTTISVSPPATGSVAHMIEYWSMDGALNTEAHHTASFVVSAP